MVVGAGTIILVDAGGTVDFVSPNLLLELFAGPRFAQALSGRWTPSTSFHLLPPQECGCFLTTAEARVSRVLCVPSVFPLQEFAQDCAVGELV